MLKPVWKIALLISLSFLKQDTEQENVAWLSRVTAYEMCTPQSMLETFAANNKVVKVYYHWTLSIPEQLHLHSSENPHSFTTLDVRNTRCFIEWMFMLLTSFINVTNPALTHACRRPQGHRYMFLREDGQGLNSHLWRENALTAFQGYTHRMESIHKNSPTITRSFPKLPLSYLPATFSIWLLPHNYSAWNFTCNLSFSGMSESSHNTLCCKHCLIGRSQAHFGKLFTTRSADYHQ